MQAAVQQQQEEQDQEVLDPALQSNWRKIVNESRFRVKEIIDLYGFHDSCFFSWLRCATSPNKTNREKMVKAMTHANNEKRLPYHPSYGYATPEQIHRLR